MRKAVNFLYLASGYLAAAFIGAIVAVVFVQVCLNLVDKLYSYIFGSALGLTIPSYSDFTGFFLAAASFLALAYTLRMGGHIRVNLLTGLMPPRLSHLFDLVALLVGLGLSGYATYYVFGLVLESYQYGDKSSGMVSVPIWIPQVPVLIGSSILTLALTDEIVRVLRGKSPSYADKGEKLMQD